MLSFVFNILVPFKIIVVNFSFCAWFWVFTVTPMGWRRWPNCLIRVPLMTAYKLCIIYIYIYKRSRLGVCLLEIYEKQQVPSSSPATDNCLIFFFFYFCLLVYVFTFCNWIIFSEFNFNLEKKCILLQGVLSKGSLLCNVPELCWSETLCGRKYSVSLLL